MEKLTSPKKIREIVSKYEFRFRKSLGQNFLIDGNILDKILDAADIGKDDTVLEIGPGIGTMTQALAEKAGWVFAVEIDKNLVEILKETLGEYNNIEIINQDVLKFDIVDFVEGLNLKKIKIIANLPYYITSPVILKVIGSKEVISMAVFMIQREVARRLTASPGTKDYGSLTVFVNYFTYPEVVFDVPNTVFIPQPKVESSVVRLIMRNKPPIEVHDEKLFFEVVRASFNQRRKTLLNSLLNIEDLKEMDKNTLKMALEEADISPGIRGEALSMEEFARVSNILYNLKTP